jgi:hypothetical protein
MCPERARLEDLVISLHAQVETALRERDAAIAAKVPNVTPFVRALLTARFAERDAIHELERHKNSHPCVWY